MILIAIVSFLIGGEIKQRQHQTIITQALGLYEQDKKDRHILLDTQLELEKCKNDKQNKKPIIQDNLEHYMIVNENLKTENNTLIKKNKKYKNQVRQLKQYNKQIKLENQGLSLKREKYRKEIDNLHEIISCKNKIIEEYSNLEKKW